MPREARLWSVGPVPLDVAFHGEKTPRGGAPTMGEMTSRIAQRDFAKRFERGKLSFTGDGLQVISVFGRQQKFANLLKRLTVGA
jgi:hypothetical protein